MSLLHLEDGVDDAVTTITRSFANCSPTDIDQLLINGPSWRERITGLVAASSQDIARHYASLITGFQKTGGISIVPISAAISVAVRDCNCDYKREMTDMLDRHAWDGEIGFALDWLHYTIGDAAAPDRQLGPNYGQSFHETAPVLRNSKRFIAMGCTH